MILTIKNHILPSKDEAIRLLNSNFVKQSNSKYKVPSNKDFRVFDLIEHDEGIIEIHISWNKVHWYWEPTSISKKHIYEFQFGLVILDLKSHKAIITCHNTHERRTIIDSITGVYPIGLNPLTLTKPILYQIGSFDSVKRASYFINDSDSKTPSNISYADENLSIKSIARSEEENPRSQRMQSFYLIPLGSIKEQGVGASTDSGKLWIQREIPITSIREYGMALLDKIGQTLNNMTDKGEYNNVISSMNISQLPRITSISNVLLRTEICRLIETIINMLLNHENERPFTVNETFAINGVPRYFDYPRIQLVDNETNNVAYWIDSVYSSPTVRLMSRYGNTKINTVPGNDEIQSTSLIHPITKENIVIDNIFSHLSLLPTLYLNDLIFEAIRYISNQIDKLRGIVCLPFRIDSNIILLDVNRAYNKSGLGLIPTKIEPNELFEIQRLMMVKINQTKNELLLKRLRTLGEKCTNESDDHCQSCLQDSKYICLRSLVARYLKNTIIFKHKGIELSDIQGSAHIGSDLITIFGFAKSGNLTSRNKQGASILAQVIMQIEKSSFNTVLIISPLTINEDIRDRLISVSSVYGKRIIFFDQNVLVRLLFDFEEQSEFDSVNIEEIYRNSKKTIKSYL